MTFIFDNSIRQNNSVTKNNEKLQKPARLSIKTGKFIYVAKLHLIHLCVYHFNDMYKKVSSFLILIPIEKTNNLLVKQ